MLPIFISVLCGVTFASLISGIYTDKLNNTINSRKIYVLSQKFPNFEEMNQQNDDYLYYENNNEYKQILGITKDIKNIDKIKKIYNTDINVEEYQISSVEVLGKLTELDLELSLENNQTKQQEIINNTLELYKNQKINLIINS